MEKKLFDRFKRKGISTIFSNQSTPIQDGDDLLSYYASLALYHPDIILVFSPNGQIVSQNRDSIRKILGFSPEQGTDFKRSMPPETYDMLHLAFKQALKGNAERLEVNLPTIYDELIYLSTTFIPIKASDNVVEGVYILVQNITEKVELRQTLLIRETHLNTAQTVAKVGSWEYLIAEDKLTCSDNFYDIFGIDKTVALPMNSTYELVHPDDYGTTWDIMSESLQKGTGYTADFRIHHGKTMQVRYLRVQAETIRKNEKPYKLVGVIKDNTEQKLLELKLTETNNRLIHIYDNLSIGIWMREKIDGNIVFASKGIEDILQIPLEKLYKEPDYWMNMILHSHRQEVFKAFKRLRNGERIQVKYRIKSGDGKTKWLAEETIPWVDENGEITNLFGMVIDISSEIEMQERLQYIASYDSLTALPNQKTLYEKIDKLCENNQPFALLYLDLDRLNVINDSLGYHVGDELLIRVTNRLTQALPESGFLSRISSNDFVILIKDYASKDSLFQFAEDIITRIQKPMTIKEFDLQVTTSMGISFFPEDGRDKLTLLENGHTALFHAKKHGKNNYQIYSNSRDISSYKKFILEKDMRKAYVNEEFEIYYQPQVNEKGILQGAEALLRWNHHDWGLISPGEFIPLAEENHLINNIGDWVIRKVCAQLRDWKDKGYTLRPIAVNLSPIRFMKKGLVELVKEQLEIYSIPARYLEFEITEGSKLKSENSVLTALKGLKELGVKIAIDDFGVGYSSLSYLQEFQADTIKIDRSFVQNLSPENKTENAIVSTVLHLAKGLDMKVVAEGVEEYDQYLFLKQKECDIFQGYLFSKPIPLRQFEKILKVGYIKLNVQKRTFSKENERRESFRFDFPYPLLGEMKILEVNNRKVNLGSAKILIENLSIGGLKVLSTLRLPIHTNMKFNFTFQIMNETFHLSGTFVWKSQSKEETFFYGIAFDTTEQEQNRLAEIINKMTVLSNLNQEIPNTTFIYENTYAYLRKNPL
ncbi:EAL domain-containing protein [Oceanobacillus bengalensis]|nr:EAL domain-containing protein [Oceanobacillus bengalensis]